MSGKISGFLREYTFGLSIFFTIVGFIVLFMGVRWYFLKELKLGFYTDIIDKVGNWNFYLLIIGLVVFGWFGVYYLYTYLKNRKYVIAELETNKRSEFLKVHSVVKNKIKHLPSKYKKMLKEKEQELKIK